MTELHPFAELRSTGLLWLINRATFHPRGFALAVQIDENGATGWSLEGNGTEVWGFSQEVDDAKFAAAEAFLAQQRTIVPVHENGPVMELVPEPPKVPRSNGWRQRKREREERERLEDQAAADAEPEDDITEREARQQRARKRAADNIYG